MKRLLFLMLCVSGLPVLAQPPDPGLLERYAAEGERALAERRYDEAARAYERLRDLSPGTAEVHAKLGLIYYQERDYEHAVPALRRAMKLKPTLPKLDVLLAMCLSELGQYREALPGLRRVHPGGGRDLPVLRLRLPDRVDARGTQVTVPAVAKLLRRWVHPRCSHGRHPHVRRQLS